jgi:mono/diheme cytochrome c family protein
MVGWRIAVVAGLVLAATPARAQQVGDVVTGERLAAEMCAGCHAVRPDQILIPNADATHFADTASRPGMTATALRVWLRTSHPTMPDIILGPDETDDIVAYIMSLKGL